MTQKRGVYGRHTAWPITCPLFRKNSKYRCGNNEQVCAQGTVPPLPHALPSTPVSFTDTLLFDPFVCLLVCCLSPSWECPLPKSRDFAWLAHSISPRGLRPSHSVHFMCYVLPGARSGVLVTKAGPWEKIRHKARRWFFPWKNTAIATLKGSILLKEHVPVSSQYRPGSCWGKETTLPLLPATTTKHLLFVNTWGNRYLRTALPSSLKCKVVERQREVTAGGFEKTQP